MPDILWLLLALGSLTIGVVLLKDAASYSDVGQSAQILGGAIVFSIGSLSMALSLKSWVKREKEYRGE
jgi:hypothetical protein